MKTLRKRGGPQVKRKAATIANKKCATSSKDRDELIKLNDLPAEVLSDRVQDGQKLPHSVQPLAKALREILECKGKEWTQKRLALKSDMFEATISQILSGKRNLTLATLERLAKALDVPIDFIFILASDSMPNYEADEKLSHLKVQVKRLISPIPAGKHPRDIHPSSMPQKSTT
jgi:transcriptional regulator with XRE-family HTH domain